jgi:hypothetical protein
MVGAGTWALLKIPPELSTEHSRFALTGRCEQVNLTGPPPVIMAWRVLVHQGMVVPRVFRPSANASGRAFFILGSIGYGAEYELR